MRSYVMSSVSKMGVMVRFLGTPWTEVRRSSTTSSSWRWVSMTALMLHELVGFADALDEGDGVALGDVVEAEAFRGFGLDADLVELDGEQVGDAGAHIAGDGRDFGRGEDEGDVDVDDAVAGVLELLKWRG
jgi:hypothetical protein